LVCALGLPDAAVAQSASRRIVGHDHAFVVETSVVPAPNAPAPEYPAALRTMRLDGEVLVQFVVDTNGVIDLNSLRVRQTTHPLFVDAVRVVLGKWQFTPGKRDGHLVRQWVQRRIKFTAPR
jgi:protein TonB